MYGQADLPFKMKTLSGISAPPNPPQPALTKALAPAFSTASKIVSVWISYFSFPEECGRGIFKKGLTRHRRSVLHDDRTESDIDWRLASFEERR